VGAGCRVAAARELGAPADRRALFVAAAGRDGGADDAAAWGGLSVAAAVA